MNNFFRQKGSETQQPGGFFASLQVSAVSRSVLHWLAGLPQLTEEEQNDAGIYYPGHQPPPLNPV